MVHLIQQLAYESIFTSLHIISLSVVVTTVGVVLYQQRNKDGMSSHGCLLVGCKVPCAHRISSSFSAESFHPHTKFENPKTPQNNTRPERLVNVFHLGGDDFSVFSCLHLFGKQGLKKDPCT